MSCSYKCLIAFWSGPAYFIHYSEVIADNPSKSEIETQSSIPSKFKPVLLYPETNVGPVESDGRSVPWFTATDESPTGYRLNINVTISP